MSNSQNEDLLSAARRADQQGGNPLFQINPERIDRPRVWQNGTVVQEAVRFHLGQLRAPNGEFMGEAISEAFVQGLRNFVHRERINPVQDYSMWIAINHNTGTHTWTSCPVLLFFKNRGRGSGLKNNNPGNMSYEQMLKKKRSIIEIKNNDELCAARAIVTMKVLAE